VDEENQVTSLQIPTSDGDSLFAWLVTPLKLYLQNETEIIGQASMSLKDLRSTVAFKLLSQNTNSRLVIYCESSDINETGLCHALERTLT
jgi:hypothetical protein